MFPLKERILIRGAQGHLNAGLGIGADYRAKYVPFVIPFDGVVSTYWGKEGGNWLRLTRPNGDKIELAHLQSYAVKSGSAKEGQAGGVTGNTGAITDFPHLHIQIIDKNGKRLDPEQYNWETKMTNLHLTIVANKNTWTNLESQLSTLAEWVNEYSRSRITLTTDIQRTSFENIPFQDWMGVKSVDVGWYRESVTPLGKGHATFLMVNPDQWKSPNSQGTMTWGDPGKPARLEGMAVQNGDAFVSNVFHELCHALFFFTEQKDAYEGRWVVHDYLLQTPPKRYELLDLIDYAKLQAKLSTINVTKENKEVIVQKQGEGTLYLLGEGKLFAIATDYPTYQSQFGNTPVAVLPAAEFGKYPVSSLKLKL